MREVHQVGSVSRQELTTEKHHVINVPPTHALPTKIQATMPPSVVRLVVGRKMRLGVTRAIQLAISARRKLVRMVKPRTAMFQNVAHLAGGQSLQQVVTPEMQLAINVKPTHALRRLMCLIMRNVQVGAPQVMIRDAWDGHVTRGIPQTVPVVM